MALAGVATGRTTDSAIAPMRVTVTGGSYGIVWSTDTLFVASRTMIRDDPELIHAYPSSLASIAPETWNVPT